MLYIMLTRAHTPCLADTITILSSQLLLIYTLYLVQFAKLNPKSALFVLNHTQHCHSFCCHMTPQHSQYHNPLHSFTKFLTPPLLIITVIFSFNNNNIQFVFICIINILSLIILHFTKILNVKF